MRKDYSKVELVYNSKDKTIKERVVIKPYEIKYKYRNNDEKIDWARRIVDADADSFCHELRDFLIYKLFVPFAKVSNPDEERIDFIITNADETTNRHYITLETGKKFIKDLKDLFEAHYPDDLELPKFLN